MSERMTPEREAQLRASENLGYKMAREVFDELDATRADLAELVAVLPKCDAVYTEHGGLRSCERTATHRPQDPPQEGDCRYWCDEHTPKDRTAMDFDFPEETDWSAILRRIDARKGTG